MSHFPCTGVAGLVAQTARAQDFGLPGQVVLGAERMTGIYSDHLKSTTTTTAGGVTTNQEYKLNSTTFALLGVPMAIGLNSGNSGYVWPTSSPRISADVFVARGFSLGGSFVYLNRSGSNDTTTSLGGASTTTSQDAPTGSSVLFSPRIGYAVQLAPSFAIWPRAGITYAYYHVTVKNTDLTTGVVTENKLSADFTDVSIEVMGVALPVPHVAILFGPFLDLPLGGGTKTVNNGVEQPNPASLSYLSSGISAGLAVYF
jgi:hypothetical protein